MAIQRLSEKNDLRVVSPTERVTLARAYKVPSWLLQGFRELAEKKGLVSRSDAKIIGFETTFKLAHICISSGGDKPLSQSRGLSFNRGYHEWWNLGWLRRLMRSFRSLRKGLVCTL